MRCEKISIQKGSSGEEMKEKDKMNDREKSERKMIQREGRGEKLSSVAISRQLSFMTFNPSFLPFLLLFIVCGGRSKLPSFPWKKEEDGRERENWEKKGEKKAMQKIERMIFFMVWKSDVNKKLMSWNANDRVYNNEQEFLIAICNPVNVILVVGLMREFFVWRGLEWFSLLWQPDRITKWPVNGRLSKYQK